MGQGFADAENRTSRMIRTGRTAGEVVDGLAALRTLNEQSDTIR